MSELAKLQSDFQAYLQGRLSGADLTEYIVDDKTVGASKRLSLYFDAYRLRLIETLQTQYPKLTALMGDDLFDQTARSYIDAYPSPHRNMRWVGDQMSAHLTNTLPQHPVTTEMASFEWALGLAFDATNAPNLTLDDLSDISAEKWAALCFTFHPSVQLLNTTWNVIPIWQALDTETAPPAPIKTNTPCLIWRSDLNSHYRSLETSEYEAIKCVMNGMTFGTLCEQLEIVYAESASEQAANYLASWINAGLLTKVN